MGQIRVLGFHHDGKREKGVVFDYGDGDHDDGDDDDDDDQSERIPVEA